MNTSVSVIIPVYNSEKTLRRCVESLVYGTEKNVEVILVDDCSKDSSWELCQQLQTEFEAVLSVQNKKNSGVSYTRNQGLLRANSPYIMFVDSDDWVSRHFISQLLHTVEKHKEAQVLCGFHYIDQLTYSKMDYQWDKQCRENLIEIQGEELFDAVDKIMMQNVWNKIFEREIIQKNNIQFDETQSMGEDFGFVLDYMMAAGLKKCMIINEPLYYYVRANQTSLMSNFGWSIDDQAFQRMEQLAKICGETLPNIQKRLEKQIYNLKRNSVYHVVRTQSHTKKEKLKRIEQILGDGTGKAFYQQQMIIYHKEKVINLISEVKRFKDRVRGKIKHQKRDAIIKKEKQRLRAEDFSVISQNCIGGVFYHDMGKKFLSPTVDLFFKEPDFIKFVSNLKYYLNLELDMRWEEEYPVGKLSDIDIYFMHYSSCKEAKEAWERRKKRVEFEKILVIATDRNGFTHDMYEQWKKIPYSKVLFTVNQKFAEEEGAILFPKYVEEGVVPDLIPNREFYKNHVLVDTVNSMETGE